MGKLLDIPGFAVVEDKDLGETKMFTSRRQDYEAEVERVHCNMYAQCPVCYKCMHKAGHMYEQCETCKVPLCHHNEKSRALLIKPKNFTIEAKGLLAESLDKNIQEYEQSKQKCEGCTNCTCGKEDKEKERKDNAD